MNLQGYQYIKNESAKTSGAVQYEILQLMRLGGEYPLRGLIQLSVFSKWQVAFALARQMKYGRVARCGNGFCRTDIG